PRPRIQDRIRPLKVCALGGVGRFWGVSGGAAPPDRNTTIVTARRRVSKVHGTRRKRHKKRVSPSSEAGTLNFASWGRSSRRRRKRAPWEALQRLGCSYWVR